TAGSTSRRSPPRTNSIAGGSYSPSRRRGYSGSSNATERAPHASSAEQRSSGSSRRANARSLSLPAAPLRTAARHADAVECLRVSDRRRLAVRPRSEERTSNARRSAAVAAKPSGYPSGISLLESSVPWIAPVRSARTGEISRVERGAVRERLRDVIGAGMLRAGEVRDRAGDLQGAVEPAAGERERLHGLREQALRRGRQPGLASRERSWQLTVAGDAEGRVAGSLSLPRGLHPLPQGLGGLPRRLAEQLALR